jgi:hypothetical protein
MTEAQAGLIPAPEELGILMLEQGKTLFDIEAADHPFFVGTSLGWYAYKPGLYAKSFLPMKGGPPRLADLEGTEIRGRIIPTGVRFPMWLVNQAVDFFTRIYDAHKTEAEVAVTYNWQEKRFRVFVPEQYVASGGVSYKLDMTKLQRGWAVVGTIHSHCNFGAFHSGTDTHDADHQDGMHMTIGMLKRAEGPQFAQMLSFGPIRVDLDFSEAVDLEAVDGPATAPGWWDRHVHTTGTAPWEIRRGPTLIQGSGDRGYFSTPSGHRSTYDLWNAALKDEHGPRRYILPENWIRPSGERFKLPFNLPVGMKTWTDWCFSENIDPRTFLFNAENFPEFFKKNPNNTQFFLTSEEAITAIGKFGSEYPKFENKQMEPEKKKEPEQKSEAPKDHKANNRAAKQRKWEKKHGKHRDSPITTVTDFTEEMFEGWWAYVLKEATNSHISITQQIEEMGQVGISVDPIAKSVTFSKGMERHLADNNDWAFDDDKDGLKMDFKDLQENLEFLKHEAKAIGFDFDYTLTHKGGQMLLTAGME